MNIVIIPVTPFQQNCTLLCCEKSGKAAVVDPGGEVDRILQTAEANNTEIEKILVTHAHVDHAGAAAELARRLAIPIEGPHKDDQFWIDMIAQEGANFGFSGVEPFEPNRWLEQGDTVKFGEIELEVYHCPGHTPGHVIFHHPGQRLAIVGDVIFQGSIGRTDFPRSDHAALINSIKERLWPLGDDVQFLPGHGPRSTFGQERKTNPFVGDHIST